MTNGFLSTGPGLLLTNLFDRLLLWLTFLRSFWLVLKVYPARQNGEFGQNFSYFPIIFCWFSADGTPSAVFPPNFRLTFRSFSAGPVLQGTAAIPVSLFTMLLSQPKVSVKHTHGRRLFVIIHQLFFARKNPTWPLDHNKKIDLGQRQDIESFKVPCSESRFLRRVRPDLTRYLL